MALVQAPNGVPARAAWPQRNAYLKDGLDNDTSGHVIPRDWETMCEVFKIEPRDEPGMDLSRRMGVFWQGDVKQKPVSMRLWGFVKDVVMTPTGNWDGRKENAARAMQFLVLEGRDNTVAFSPQLRAIRDIREYVAMTLGGGFNSSIQHETIYAQHRVFRKLRASDAVAGFRYKSGEDPLGRAEKIQRQWRIAGKPQFLRQEETGHLVVTSSLAFRKGDFVEVEVFPDIVFKENRGRDDNFVRVNFELLKATKLLSVTQVEQSLMAEASQPHHRSEHEAPEVGLD